jgi:hypothetical protein
MMNQNVKIAKELVKLAKSLIADTQEWYIYVTDTATGEPMEHARDYNKIFSNEQQARNYCKKRNEECARDMVDAHYSCYPITEGDGDDYGEDDDYGY